MTEARDIKLPAELCAAAEKKFAGTFGSLEEMLEFVLRELTREDAVRLNETEQKLVEDRLRELGYL